MFDLAVSLWVIDGSIIELDAHVFAPEFYLMAVKFVPLSVMMLWGTP